MIREVDGPLQNCEVAFSTVTSVERKKAVTFFLPSIIQANTKIGKRKGDRHIPSKEKREEVRWCINTTVKLRLKYEELSRALNISPSVQIHEISYHRFTIDML